MSTALLRCAGGTLERPGLLLNDRADGGHLLVNPPRPVWERHVLTAGELRDWSFLVAASGRAMLETLPQLKGGCLNYWEAGNWALNDGADPVGPKVPQAHRRVHLHLLGRAVQSAHPDWRWGESPRFPAWTESKAWSAAFAPLTDPECDAIADRARHLLAEVYGLAAERGIS